MPCWVTYDMLISVKNLFQRHPPLARRATFQWHLERLRVSPPLARAGVRRHSGHIGLKIRANVLKVGKEQRALPKNSVIAYIARMNRRQHVRPDRRVQTFVFFDAFRLQTDDLSKAAHNYLLSSAHAGPSG